MQADFVRQLEAARVFVLDHRFENSLAQSYDVKMHRIRRSSGLFLAGQFSLIQHPPDYAEAGQLSALGRE